MKPFANFVQRPPIARGLMVTLIVAWFAFAACDDASVPDSGLSDSDQGLDRPPALTQIEGVRSRADDAFAALDEEFAKSETRVGPQPWPRDLPPRWPRPAEATLVADTKQAAGDRLMLVNLPGPPDRAVERYSEALSASGYEVDPAKSRKPGSALHVRGENHEAVLIFFAREKATRVEILFLTRAAG
jgi:hypothetical protein